MSHNTGIERLIDKHPACMEYGFIGHTKGPGLLAKECNLPAAYSDVSGVTIHTQSLRTDQGNFVYVCSLVGLDASLERIARSVSDGASQKANRLFLRAAKAKVDGIKGPRETDFRDNGSALISIINNEKGGVFVAMSQIGETSERMHRAEDAAPVYAKLAVGGKPKQLKNVLSILNAKRAQSTGKIKALTR